MCNLSLPWRPRGRCCCPHWKAPRRCELSYVPKAALRVPEHCRPLEPGARDPRPSAGRQTCRATFQKIPVGALTLPEKIGGGGCGKEGKGREENRHCIVFGNTGAQVDFMVDAPSSSERRRCVGAELGAHALCSLRRSTWKMEALATSLAHGGALWGQPCVWSGVVHAQRPCALLPHRWQPDFCTSGNLCVIYGLHCLEPREWVSRHLCKSLG